MDSIHHAAYVASSIHTADLLMIAKIQFMGKVMLDTDLPKDEKELTQYLKQWESVYHVIEEQAVRSRYSSLEGVDDFGFLSYFRKSRK